MRFQRLSNKFLCFAVGLLLLALLSIGLTMWITRQLDGGAAAVNEAGRLRMQAWRLTSGVQGGRSPAEQAELIVEFEGTLELQVVRLVAHLALEPAVELLQLRWRCGPYGAWRPRWKRRA